MKLTAFYVKLSHLPWTSIWDLLPNVHRSAYDSLELIAQFIWNTMKIFENT